MKTKPWIFWTAFIAFVLFLPLMIVAEILRKTTVALYYVIKDTTEDVLCNVSDFWKLKP